MSTDFLDSNIFVYHIDGYFREKSSLAKALVSDRLADGGAVTSFQVVQETLNVVTRKIAVPITGEQAQIFLDDVLARFWTIMPTARLYGAALRLQSRYGIPFYDSLIVAAALEAGCDRLLSEDFQDGQRIEGLTVVNPFRDVS
ncbi:MAG: PIN domain-containing protein [Dehalococcoidia bacterium]|jgi:predicted nucleic acid-binding protein